MPSVALYRVECTFPCGFDSFRAHHLTPWWWHLEQFSKPRRISFLTVKSLRTLIDAASRLPPIHNVLFSLSRSRKAELLRSNLGCSSSAVPNSHTCFRELLSHLRHNLIYTRLRGMTHGNNNGVHVPVAYR